MNRPAGFSQRPLRLVQPYDDAASETRSAMPQRESDPHSQLLLHRQSRGSSTSTALLESIHAPGARRGEVRKGEASFTPLPPFPARGRYKPTGGASPSMSSIHGEGGADDPASVSARSSPGPTLQLTASVDRLAALYQQYQIPMPDKSRGGTLRESSRVVRNTTSPTPPPALPPTGGLERQGRAVDSPNSSVLLPHHSESPSTPRREHSSGPSNNSHPRQRGELSTGSRQREVKRDEERGDGRTGCLPHTAHTNRLFPTDGSSPPMRSAGVSTTEASRLGQPLQRQPGGAVVTLPTALSGPGVEGLMNTAVFVWAALGFFEMRPNESDGGGDADSDSDDVGSGAEGDRQSVVSSALREPSDPHDTEAFLFALEDFLSLFGSGAAGVPTATLVAHTALMRNGLWRVLFNAVFYCVSVLDARSRRRGSISGKEREVRTGGPEDAFEVVFPSSSSLDEEDGGEASEEREVPVRLIWRAPGESDEQRAARCARDPLPSDSPLWASGSPHRSQLGRQADTECRSSSGRGGPSERRASPPTDLFGGRLRTPPPMADWYFTLRCLAQVGYRRDAFYLQTPSSASPFELLLALLWLTQQYKLLAVAEYVELNRRYGYLLQYHVEDAFWRGPLCGSAGDHSAVPTSRLALARERLLYNFSHASVWPPVSFDESSAIQLRLVQLERCLGRSSSPESPPTPAVQLEGPSASTLQVRRLLAVRRLMSLSLNRLHHALQRQVEQTTQLGLHSSLDAQVCQKEHHDLYEEVMAGLTHVQQTEQRLQAAAEGLGKAGSLVAFLLRYEEAVVPADEVLLALEEDDATWLESLDVDEEQGDSSSALRSPPQRSTKGPKGTATAERWRRAVRRGTLSQQAVSSLPTSAAALAQSLSTFRATRSRAVLTETWKRLLRRSHVAPHTIPPENLRFLLDVEAQAIQEARVRENMTSRYSLQAALAAELAVLGYERQQQRRQRSPSRSPPRHTDSRDGKRVGESVSSHRTADAEADAEARPVRVVLPSLELVTNAATTFAQLRSEEEAYDPVTLSTAEMQLMEVGEPAAGSTTSARLELERLQAWEQELEAQLDARTQTEARVEHCKGMLETLYHQFGLRMATPVVPGKAR